MIESILLGLRYVCDYFDDILITGTSEEEHWKNPSGVLLLRLENAGIHLKKGKCNFMLSEVQYLGHKISAKGLELSGGIQSD